MRFTLTLAALLAAASVAFAQHDVKGQTQLAGGTAQFGQTYSLKNKFNFAILGARYTQEPYNAYTPILADKENKVVVVDIAMKNATTNDQFFDPGSFMTLVDEHGELIPGSSMMLQSKPVDSGSFTLKPGQGLGQVALKDPLHLAFLVPAKSRIEKIIVNVGRLNTSEEVVRYLLVAPPKEGEKVTNPNFIKPLPVNAAAPGDGFGAVAMPEGKGATGMYVPSGPFELRLDSVGSPDDAKFDGNGPEDGKKFVVMTLTAKSMLSRDEGMFDVEGGDEPTYRVFDADGEEYKPFGFRKTKADEDPNKEFHLGDEYTYRVYFVLPKDSKIKRVVYGAGGANKWTVDIAG